MTAIQEAYLDKLRAARNADSRRSQYHKQGDYKNRDIARDERDRLHEEARAIYNSPEAVRERKERMQSYKEWRDTFDALTEELSNYPTRDLRYILGKLLTGEF